MQPPELRASSRKGRLSALALQVGPPVPGAADQSNAAYLPVRVRPEPHLPVRVHPGVHRAGISIALCFSSRPFARARAAGTRRPPPRSPAGSVVFISSVQHQFGRPRTSASSPSGNASPSRLPDLAQDAVGDQGDLERVAIHDHARVRRRVSRTDLSRRDTAGPPRAPLLTMSVLVDRRAPSRRSEVRDDRRVEFVAKHTVLVAVVDVGVVVDLDHHGAPADLTMSTP